MRLPIARPAGAPALSAALLLLAATAVSAQDAPPPDVRGTIVEARTGEPMPGVMIRLVREGDPDDVLEIASTDAEGRWEIRLRLDEDPGPVVVEAEALGHLSVRSEPFRLESGETVDAPELQVEPDPVELDALEVRGERRWWQHRHPRDIVRDRQLLGRGTFIPGVVLGRVETRSAAEAIAELVDDLEVEYNRRGTPTLRSARVGDCPIVLVNGWRVDPNQSTFSLGLSGPDEIGVVEYYPSYTDVPEDLRRRIALEVDRAGGRGERTLRAAFYDEESCGVVNVWRWSEWNRGRGGGN